MNCKYEVDRKLISLLVFSLIFLVYATHSCRQREKFLQIATPSIRILNNWRFQTDIFDIGEKEAWFNDAFDKSDWARKPVPAAWDTYDESLWGYEGVGWYYTQINGRKLEKNSYIRLRFNRVGYFSKVWLNGRLIAENDDGYLPFEIDVSGLIDRKNINTLVIRVDNRPNDFKFLPQAQQIEWVQYGGILQSVELIQSGAIRIKDVIIKTEIKNEKANVRIIISLRNKLSEDKSVKMALRLINESGEAVEKSLILVCPADSSIFDSLLLKINKPALWSPENPSLYNLSVAISHDEKIIDAEDYYFGIRTIKTAGRRLILNDKLIYLKGVNRYDILGRKGHMTDENTIRRDLLRIKELGANVIRVHYPQSSLMLDLADEIGLMIIEELPINWWGQNWWDNKSVEQDTSLLIYAKCMLQKMIERDKNHPCIIAWSMANESKTETKTGTYVINRLIKETRALDDTRLITFTVNNEAGRHRAFENADFISCNIYYGNDNAYHIDLLDSLVRIASEKKLKAQCRYFPDKPLIVSEFGAAGLYGIHGDVIFSEEWQAEYIRQVWMAIKNVPECGGVVLWSWRDYYHRKYFTNTYAPFGPYGILNVRSIPKKSFYILKKLYGGQKNE